MDCSVVSPLSATRVLDKHEPIVEQSEASLTIISYDDLKNNNSEAVEALKKALFSHGIVGVRRIEGYQQLVENYVKAAKAFARLDAETKARYSPNRDEGFLGYEIGKEKFKNSDNVEVVDDCKASYYAFVPDHADNKWPTEVDLKTPYQEVGKLMIQVGTEVMQAIGLVGPNAPVDQLGDDHVGRGLYYSKVSDSHKGNPLWCGAHYDHGIFTALLPAVYIDEKGNQIPEPEEAGLFVRAPDAKEFKKVRADDPDVMLFQVGEWGQIASNDKILATEHYVQKAVGHVERITMALFFKTPFEYVIESTSKLAQDGRYGGGRTCKYLDWHNASLKRYEVK